MLLQTPRNIEEKFEQALASAGVAVNQRPHFQRWLRYFLDFCLKYTQDPRLETSLEAFSQKLESKGQEPWKRHQALDAVRLYWDMLGSQSNRAGENSGGKQGPGENRDRPRFSARLGSVLCCYCL
jgi:hypothetical protein